jgi:hypothetical protein
MVWVGPVTLAQTDAPRLLKLIGAPERATADSRVIPAGMALVLERGAQLRLHMRDSSVVEGRFLRRMLLDSASYAPRFAARARTSSFIPLALGETLRVALRDGREWTAPFAGYAELTLLLRDPDGPQYLRVPFEFASTIHRASGDSLQPAALTRAFQAGLLPSAEAIEMRIRQDMRGVPGRDDAVRVAVEDVESATVESDSGISAAGVILLSVVVTIGVIYFIVRSSKPPKPLCSPALPPRLFSRDQVGIRFTTRPFDRDRGCFVDDPLATAGAWSDRTESGLQATRVP